MTEFWNQCRGHIWQYARALKPYQLRMWMQLSATILPAMAVVNGSYHTTGNPES